MTKPQNPKKLDALALVARTALRDRRRSPWKASLIFLLLLLVAGFLVWKVSPSGHYPQLVVGIFDQLALPGEQVPVRAKLEVANPAEVETRLSGCDLFLRIGDADWQPIQSDKDGTAML